MAREIELDRSKIEDYPAHLRACWQEHLKPRKPAHTIRRVDSNLGMGSAMHWAECRRFSLQEFRRFSSFPDGFTFAGESPRGSGNRVNRVPPLFMRAIARHIRRVFLQESPMEEVA